MSGKATDILTKQAYERIRSGKELEATIDAFARYAKATEVHIRGRRTAERWAEYDSARKVLADAGWLE